MTRRQAPLIAGLVSVVLAVIVVVALILPKLSDVRDREGELEQAQQQEQVLRAQLAQLEEAREQAEEVQAELARLEAEVPRTADLPGLIRLLQGAADQAAVDFMSVAPGTPAVPPDGNFSVIPTQITVVGRFFSLDEFLFLLEDLPRAVKVTALTLAAGPDGLPQLQASVTAEVYTSDTSAGPGSVPGPSGPGAPAPAPAPTPEASPSPGGTPTPEVEE